MTTFRCSPFILICFFFLILHCRIVFLSVKTQKIHDEFENAQICQMDDFNTCRIDSRSLKCLFGIFRLDFIWRADGCAKVCYLPETKHFDGFNCPAWGILTGRKSIGLFSIPFCVWRDIYWNYCRRITARIWKQNKTIYSLLAVRIYFVSQRRIYCWSHRMKQEGFSL